MLPTVEVETTGTTSVREIARTTPGLTLGFGVGFGVGGNSFGDNLYIRGLELGLAGQITDGFAR